MGSECAETKDKQNRFLDLLKGIAKINGPEFITFPMKDICGTACKKVKDHKIESKYLPLNGERLLVKTFQDVFIYLLEKNVVDILYNNKFLSCKMTREVKDFFICKTTELHIFVQHEDNVVIYLFDEEKVRLNEIKKIQFTVVDLLPAKNGEHIFCCVSVEDKLNIYKMEKASLSPGKPIASYKKLVCDKKSVRRLFSVNEHVYFYQNGLLTNIKTPKDFFSGNQIFCLNGTTIMLRKDCNKTNVILMGNGAKKKSYEYNSVFRIKLVDDMVILYNPQRLMFYDISSNQLNLIKEIKHTTTDFVIRSNEILMHKDLIKVIFIVKGKQMKNEEQLDVSSVISEPYLICETRSEILNPFIYKPFDDRNNRSNLSLYNSSMDDLLFNLNIIPQEKKQEFRMDDEKMIENNKKTEKTPLETHKDVLGIDTVNHILQNMNNKIDMLWKKIEEERIKNEQDSKMKFKRLLDSISQHLNEKLISTIESAVKNEIRISNLQTKKFIADSLAGVEKTNETTMKSLFDKMDLRSLNSEDPDSSMYIKAFKDILTNKIVPVVESCFEEMRIQMIEELKSKRRVPLDDTGNQTISIKDEILNLIQCDNINDAAMMAMDCDDETFLLFVENASGAHLEGIDFSLQGNLLKKGIHLYEETGFESLIGFISSVLMCLELHEINTSDLADLIEMLNDMEAIDWKDNENIKLIIALQRKQASKLMVKKSLK